MDMDQSKLNPVNAESVTEFSKNVILFTDKSLYLPKEGLTN